MVKIPCNSEATFNLMRERALRDFPYGLLNSEFSEEQKIAFLYFWDTDYIPPEWEEYIVRPVTKVSDQKGVSEEHK